MSETPGRKLYADAYPHLNRMTSYFRGGKTDCDHDYDPAVPPREVDDCTYAFECTRCSGELFVEVFD